MAERYVSGWEQFQHKLTLNFSSGMVRAVWEGMMKGMFTDINPRVLGLRLQEGRKERGLIQQEAADHIRVARTTMTAIEKGERPIQPGEILRLSALYGRAVHEFLREQAPVTDFTMQFGTSLNQNGLDSPEVASAIHEFQHLSEDYLEPEELSCSSIPRRYPVPYDVGNTPAEQAAEDVATAERNRLGLGDGPIPNLRDVLENDIGIRVFYLKMPSKIAALLVFDDRIGGCITVNAGHPEQRRRWSMAHEYGHFLTRRYQPDVMFLAAYRRVPESERFADTSAKLFLMPSSGLSRRFNELKRARQGAITPADCVKLAHFYDVSFEALVRHLESQRMLPAGIYDDLIGRGFKVREAQDLLKLPLYASACPSREALPFRYKLLAAEAYKREEITEGQFAGFLRVDRLGARELYESLSRSLSLSNDGEVNEIELDLGERIA